VFEKNKLTVSGELDARGFPGSQVNVKLLFDGLQADSRTVELPQSDGHSKVELSYVPTTPGEHKVTLTVTEPEPKRGELVDSNNTISTFVTVLKGGLRVQFLDGGLEAWESQFIRKALDKSPDIKVDFQWVRDRLPPHCSIAACTTCSSCATFLAIDCRLSRSIGCRRRWNRVPGSR
jgi:hypothetical protein